MRLRTAIFGAFALLTGFGPGADALGQSEDAWKGFRGDVFGDRPIRENSPVVLLTAPVRAEDAALVPV